MSGEPPEGSPPYIVGEEPLSPNPIRCSQIRQGGRKRISQPVACAGHRRAKKYAVQFVQDNEGLGMVFDCNERGPRLAARVWQGRGLETAEFIAVITTTTGSVFGYWWLVERYLFPGAAGSFLRFWCPRRNCGKGSEA